MSTATLTDGDGIMEEAAEPSARRRYGSDGIWTKLGLIVLSILTTIVLGLSSWTLRAVIRNSERLACIEGNRFTSVDGLVVWKEIANIREEMAKIPREAPPQWFVQRVDRLELKVDQMHDELRRMGGRP